MTGEDLWIGFDGHPDLDAPVAVEVSGATPLFPLDDACDSAPLASHFVAAVAWNSTSGGMRREGYFVEPSPIRPYVWVLWCFSADSTATAWSWSARAATSFAMRFPPDAALYLVSKAWAWEREHRGTPRFDKIEEAGMLDEAEILRIADRIW